MLARSGRLSARGDFAYEVKWDGFRAIVSTENGMHVRSRRGWNMTDRVGFLADLPVPAILDGQRRSARYLPGERGWIKTKNRAYWRYEMEREGALKARRRAGALI